MKALDISRLKEIRIVVNEGRGQGHQRAAITLMEKLRELGFSGVFDVRYHELRGTHSYAGQTGRVLESLIPGFHPQDLASDKEDLLIKKNNRLGNIRINRLPAGKFNLSRVDLAMSAGDDHPKEEKYSKFNSDKYIGLQPTDWDMDSFVEERGKGRQNLQGGMRLSSKKQCELVPQDQITPTVTERRVLDVVCNGGFNSQLVYGLHPTMGRTQESGEGFVYSGNADPVSICERLVQAHKETEFSEQKPVVLLLPQDITAQGELFLRLDDKFENIHFVDLTKGEKLLDPAKYSNDAVIIAYTGGLQKDVFDRILLKDTTFPPVVEGCNARELCESAGRPFIHASDPKDKLRQYEVDSQHAEMQALHTKASSCLETGKGDYVADLGKYMAASLNPKSKLYGYHAQRKEKFLERPDACIAAMEQLGIKYKLGRDINRSTSVTSSSSKKPTNYLSGCLPSWSAMFGKSKPVTDVSIKM